MFLDSGFAIKFIFAAIVSFILLCMSGCSAQNKENQASKVSDNNEKSEASLIISDRSISMRTNLFAIERISYTFPTQSPQIHSRILQLELYGMEEKVHASCIMNRK